MNARTMRRGALALISTAALGAAGMSALAAGGVPTASRNVTNGTSELSFKPSKLQVKIPAGKSSIKVTLKYRNTGSTTHDIAIKGRGVAKVGKDADPGTGTAVTATLRAGSYTYYCTIPGHEAAGMKGTLKVVRAR